PAGAPLLRLHLRHREHAGRAPGRDAHRPGPLLRRGHTRHLPEGRRARRALGPGRVDGPLRGRRADARGGRVPETDREMKTTRERRTTTPDAGAATHGETTMHDTGTTTRGRGMPARFAASWRRVRALLVKEMRQLLRDPRTQRIIFVAPLLQLVLFSYAATTDVHDVATFLVDHDRTPASRALVDALTASGYFRIVGRFDRPADLAAALDRGRATIGVEIPRGFARDLAAGRGARVQILVDGTNSNTGTVAQGYATRIVREFGAREAMRARGGSGISPQDAAAMAFPAGSAMHTSGGGTGGLAEAPAAAGIVEHIAAGR